MIDKTHEGPKHLALLKELPIFSACKPDSLKKLASLFKPIHFKPSEVLVREGNDVDSVYLIVSGEAEVTREDQSSKKPQTLLLGILRPGSCIGLSNSGFYSQTGQRTATVSALSKMKALRLDLADFKQFLETEPEFIPELKSAAEITLRHHFIQQLKPFSKVNPIILHQAASKTEEIQVAKGHVFFQQGDEPDNCYFILDGQVEILVKPNKGKATKVANLADGDVFGELGLMIHSKRNASAIAKGPCRLLMMSRQIFQTLIEQAATEDFDAITRMIMGRIRPEKTPGITLHERLNAEHETIYILKNAELGKYFELSDVSLFIWNLLDGDHTIQELAKAFLLEYGESAQDEIGSLVLNLMNASFVKMPSFEGEIKTPDMPLWMRMIRGIRSALTYEYSIKDVDTWVGRVYQRWGYFFYTKPMVILMALIAVFGLIAFSIFLPKAEVIIKQTSNAWLLLLLMGPASIITIPAHELAHALTTKHFGYQVHRLGVGWFWLGPMAFADTSDMWLAPKRQRMIVNLAGIYSNTISSGILTFLAWLCPYPVLALFLWMVAFSSYLLAFYNLDTMFELDGYYALMDAVDKPNLRRAAITWLLDESKKTFQSKALLKQYRPEITYWVVTIIFLISSMFLAYIIQSYVFTAMVPESIGQYKPQNYRWILAVIVITMSFGSLYGMVKLQAKQQYGRGDS